MYKVRQMALSSIRYSVAFPELLAINIENPYRSSKRSFLLSWYLNIVNIVFYQFNHEVTPSV